MDLSKLPKLSQTQQTSEPATAQTPAAPASPAAETPTEFCQQCSLPLRVGARFCDACGTPTLQTTAGRASRRRSMDRYCHRRHSAVFVSAFTSMRSASFDHCLRRHQYANRRSDSIPSLRIFPARSWRDGFLSAADPRLTADASCPAPANHHARLDPRRGMRSAQYLGRGAQHERDRLSSRVPRRGCVFGLHRNPALGDVASGKMSSQKSAPTAGKTIGAQGGRGL